MLWYQGCLQEQGEMPEVWRFYTYWGFPSVQQRNISESLATSMDTWQAYAIKRNRFLSGLGKPKDLMLQVGAVYCLWQVHMWATQKICHLAMSLLACKSGYRHTQPECKQIPTQFHLITHLAYRLKPHHTRNQYLWARLDTCADINIMPASVYKLVF